MYNKWLFSRDHMNFAYPLFTSMIHMVMQFLLSGFCLTFLWPSMRPTHLPSTRDYLLKVLPCGIATGLDIGLSNSSLKVISLSFYTMVKSGAPVFVLLFAFLFGLEKPTCKLTFIILLIVSGVLLMVSGETKFNMSGYIEIQTATVLAGFRWSITQILLAKSSLGMTNPLATSLFLSPLMAASLAVASLVGGEDWVKLAKEFGTGGGAGGTLRTVSGGQLAGMLAFGGALAFLMVMAEFQLIRHTSVVTFSVSGVLKEVLTIGISMMVFADGEFTLMKGLGFVLSLVGIGIYNYVRIFGSDEDGISEDDLGDVRRRRRSTDDSNDDGDALLDSDDDNDVVASLYGMDSYASALVGEHGSLDISRHDHNRLSSFEMEVFSNK
ncbi:Triose-phosphate Transporter [Rhizoclosmatium sp. JEL0117]|nr:Triose-phosphate Transporter [Rhizoclosmatium sp. JEL0117]